MYKALLRPVLNQQRFYHWIWSMWHYKTHAAQAAHCERIMMKSIYLPMYVGSECEPEISKRATRLSMAPMIMMGM